jgi:hypothetical protein
MIVKETPAFAGLQAAVALFHIAQWQNAKKTTQA